ncbi:MAG TPA: hypothetical protein VH302_08130 [Bryobacteraceae bacterium]|nr:hypothetical protein [Bryobacteraceae bacterium]
MQAMAYILLLSVLFSSPAFANAVSSEHLGTVAFANSCAASQQMAFDRGVALLHDFWYEEAERQFQQIAVADPGCAMAHWGVAMSLFHQIWNRPGQDSMKRGWAEIEKAQTPPVKTPREREYIAALAVFYAPGKQEFQARVDAYSAAMAALYGHYPDDVDAGSFYALSILATKSPDDGSVGLERKALTVLTPLFSKYPEHPGVAHYIIHACDNPALAPQGLRAAQRYGVIAPSAAHSSHMPAHIFARLGMWQEDIDANVASVAAAKKALPDHPAAIFDQLHAQDFLVYAYLQSGQDARAKDLVDSTKLLVPHNMPGMDMRDMVTFVQTQFPVFYALEMRDWKLASALQPVTGADPDLQTLTYWARVIADGHLRQAKQAQSDLAAYESLLEQVRKGKHAYYADSTGAKIEHDEVLAWAAFAEGNAEKALTNMRAAADLQDKVGQGEVDIPAREMLADMLLELNQPQKALADYQVALQMSPNRFNGLFNAGRAAETAGDKVQAAGYYATLLKTTSDGQQSARPEFTHVKTFVAANQVASR